MKVIFFAAALIFSAATLDADGQAPLPTPIPSPEVATSMSKGPDWKLPAGQDPGLDSLKMQRQSAYSRPNAKTRFKHYVNGMVGPVALAKQVVGAGFGTWRNSPEEWGGQWEGFGRRVASNFGRNVIRQTTIYGLDSAMNLDSHFYRSKNKSVKARIYNAVISPVTARKPNGKRTVGIPRLTGAYSSSIIAYETWYPSRYDYKDGLKSGTISLGFNAAYNLFKEFVWKK